MRNNPTDAERRLWTFLRRSQMDGFKFRRQHPVAGYIVDFVSLRAKLIVELDGGQHNTPDALEYDASRTQKLESIGFRILRFWDHDVLRDPDAVLATIYRFLTQSDPHPRPLPAYREREKDYPTQ